MGLNQDRAQLTGAPLYTRNTGQGNCTALIAHCFNWLSPGAVGSTCSYVQQPGVGGSGFGDATKGDEEGRDTRIGMPQ